MLWLAITAGALVLVMTSVVLFSVVAAGMADRSVRRPVAEPRPMDRPQLAPQLADSGGDAYAFCADCRSVYETDEPDPLPPCPSCGSELTRATTGEPATATAPDASVSDTWY